MFEFKWSVFKCLHAIDCVFQYLNRRAKYSNR